MAVKIPQDVTREDKLVGPLTLKQFLYLLLGGAVVFIAYEYYAQGYLFLHEFLLIAFLGGGLTLALAFGQVNGRPFGLFLINLFKFLLSPKQLAWHKDPVEIPRIKIKGQDIKDAKTEALERKDNPKTQTEIEKLARVLDTGGTINADSGSKNSQITNLIPQTKPQVEETMLEDILSDSD